MLLDQKLLDSKENYIYKTFNECFCKLMDIIGEISPIKKEMKKKILKHCLNIESEKNTIISNINEKTMLFLKSDFKLLLTLAFHKEKTFNCKLVYSTFFFFLK